MKRTISTLLIAILLPVIAGCTRNDGDIGTWFGSWKLERITIDGLIDEKYQGDIFWQFQSSVFCMRKILPHNEHEERWGTWKELGDNMLQLDFTHTDDSHPDGKELYTPWPETHITRGITELNVLKLEVDDMRLQYTADDGTLYIYFLNKW